MEAHILRNDRRENDSGDMDTQSRPERAAQTILIVEEDEALRGILDHSLRHAGFAVGLASTVDEAFRRLEDGPDLVIAGASGPGDLSPRQAAHRPLASCCRPHLRAGCREQDARSRGRRGRFRRQADLRARGGRPREGASPTSRARTPRAVGQRRGRRHGGRTLRQRHRRRASGRSRAGRRCSPKVGRRVHHRADGRARGDLLPTGERRRCGGRPAIRARRGLSPVLLDGRATGSRVEEHPAQRHRRDATAGALDRGPGARRRVAAAAGRLARRWTRSSRSITACWPSGWRTSPTK